MVQTVTSAREFWRSQIIPFGKEPSEQKFPVGWTKPLQTFEQITDVLRPFILKDLLYLRKIKHEYVGDLLQQGWLRLWQVIKENSFFLAEMTCLKAANFVANRCGSSVLHDRLKRYISYHTLSKWSDPDTDVYEDSITDIVIGSSLKSTRIGDYALFTWRTDRFIDIERAIRNVAEWCGDDLRKLAALYYLTTSVGQTDAGRIAGLPIVEQKGRQPRCFQMRHWCKVVLARLKEELGNYQPVEPNRDDWKQCLNEGNTQPVVELAHKYADQPDRLLALYVLTTRVSRQAVVEELGVNDSALWYATKQLRQELRWSYARRLPKSA